MPFGDEGVRGDQRFVRGVGVERAAQDEVAERLPDLSVDEVVTSPAGCRG
jgi:hypothetical protein